MYFDAHTHTLKADALVNVSPEAFRPLPGYLYSVGIHPWESERADEAMWALLQRHAAHPQVRAVGEAGLDRLTRADWSRQEEAFVRQARLAEEVGKPLVVHAVRTAADILYWKKRLRPAMPWVVHGFRGNPQLAAQYAAAGLYVSVSEKCRAEALAACPVERLLVETDEATIPIEAVYARVAACLGADVQGLAVQVEQTCRRLFFPIPGL